MSEELLIPLVFVSLSIFVSALVLAFGRGQAKRDKERARSLAAELGFELEEGRSALVSALASMGEEGEERLAQLEKLPGFLKRLLSSDSVWSIRGELEGREVSLFPETRSSGKSSTTYLVVRVFYKKPLDYELRIAKEGFFTKLGKALFGLQDIELGDPAFDPLVRIKAKDPMNARLLLDAEAAKRAILDLVGAYPAAYATAAYAQWERIGLEFDAQKLRAVLAALLPVARALGG